MAAGLSAHYCVVLRVSETLAMKTSLAGSIKTYRYSPVIHFPLSAQSKVSFSDLVYFLGKHNASEIALIRNKKWLVPLFAH